MDTNLLWAPGVCSVQTLLYVLLSCCFPFIHTEGPPWPTQEEPATPSRARSVVAMGRGVLSPPKSASCPPNRVKNFFLFSQQKNCIENISASFNLWLGGTANVLLWKRLLGPSLTKENLLKSGLFNKSFSCGGCVVGVGEFVCVQVIIALPASFRSLIEINRHFNSLFYIKYSRQYQSNRLHYINSRGIIFQLRQAA